MLIFGVYTGLMNTRISSLPLEKDTAEAPLPKKKKSLLETGVNLMSTVISLILSAVVAFVFMWINVKQRDYDKLKNKPK